MKTKSPKTLPKIASLCAQWVRCGKANCRCQNGALHGPYHYLFFRKASQLHKLYVRQKHLGQVKAQLAAQRLRRQKMKIDIQSAWETWREVQHILREFSDHE